MKAGRQLQTSEDEYTSHSGLLVPTDYLIFRFSLWGTSHSKYNVLLCRSDGGYQRLTRADVQAWDLVQNNMDMLAACPYDPLLD